MTRQIILKVNGSNRTITVDPAMPLLWALREDLALTGTKFGCGVGACGSCTVHLNGNAARSCMVPVEAAESAEIITIEGLARTSSSGEAELHPVQRVWIDLQVPQCGYCQSGMIMAVAALLLRNPKPTADEVDQAISNLCRCGTYPRVRQAINRLVAEQT